MNRIIYADLIFLLNFCMDFLALFAAGKILGLKQSPIRLLFSSVFGAVYCISTFIISFSTITEMIINIAVSILMCFIAYEITSFLSFTKIFLIFYLACFMLGGGIEALYYLSGYIDSDSLGIKGSNISISFQSVVIIAGFCVFIFIIAGQAFKRRSSAGETSLKIGFGEREIEVKAFFDTGNFLIDPISSLPVIVIKLNCLCDLFDIDIIQLFCGDFISNINQAAYDGAKKMKFRLIPVKSVSVSCNIIPAFVPDYIKYKKKNTYIPINAMIAVDSKKPALYNERYGAIIPAAILD